MNIHCRNFIAAFMVLAATLLLFPRDALACYCAIKPDGTYMCQNHCLPHEVTLLLGPNPGPVERVPDDYLTSNSLETPIPSPGGNPQNPPPAPPGTGPAPTPGSAHTNRNGCYWNDIYDYICPQTRAGSPHKPGLVKGAPGTALRPPPSLNPTPGRVFPLPSPSTVNTGNAATAYQWPENFKGCTGGGDGSSSSGDAVAQAPGSAFAGAQGGGAVSKGGAGGRVIFVTNLNDSGTGSLRACIEASGPRTCVFRVGGTIELQRTLSVHNPFLTVAGQTAPGGGIQISGKKLSDYILFVMTNDVVWQYTRLRHGYNSGGSANGGSGGNVAIYGNNVIFDHNSVTWTMDESFGPWNNGQNPVAKNITFSNNLIAEGLKGHSTAFLAGGSGADQMTDIDMVRNLVMNDSHRNPLLKNRSSRIVNNIFYNMSFYATQIKGGISADIIGNIYKKGPNYMTGGNAAYHEVQVGPYEQDSRGGKDTASGNPSVYLSGNIGWNQPNPAGDQWLLTSRVTGENGRENGPVPAEWRRTTPMPSTQFPIEAAPADTIESMILPTVGASRRLDCEGNWVDVRDTTDLRLISQYQSNTGLNYIPANEDQVGGFPVIAEGTPCPDSDSDGIPDDFEAIRGAEATLQSYLNGNNVCEPEQPCSPPEDHVFDKDLYVAETGSDSNPGTKDAPFKTILKASQSAKPGTIVHVAPGTYEGGFTTDAEGTAAARIAYVSDVKWGAKIVPASGSTKATAWINKGDYVDIVGFEVDGRSGPAWKNGLAADGSYNVIKGNHVHHIADNVACDNNGGSAINATSYYNGYHIDFIGNYVHNIGSPTCKFIQGLYHSSTGTIKNNVVHDAGWNGIQMWHDATDLTVANNTVVRSFMHGIVVGSGDLYHNATGMNNNTHVSNNIVVDTPEGIRESGETGPNNTYSNNLVFNTPSVDIHLKTGKPVGTIKADPQFVDAAANDYRLKPTSPAIDKGLKTHAPANDFDLGSRPQGAEVDIGAYEYGAVPGTTASEGAGDESCQVPEPVTPTPETPATPGPTIPPSGSACNAAGGTGTATAGAITFDTGKFTKHLYVATTGSDSNPGTQDSPFKTIVKASKAATPGTLVHVAPGTYEGGFQTKASGTASARIAYISDIKWGAKIVPGAAASTGWSNAGEYVDIVNFEIDGKSNGSWKNGLSSTGSYSLMQGNRIHHVADKVACNEQGGSGINTHNYYGGYHIDVIGNVVHNIGSTGCKYIQGIYTSTSGKVKNNLVYEIGNWGIHLWHDARNLDIANNTIVKSGGGITVGGGGYYRLSAPADNVHVSNNIVVGNDKGIWQQGDNGKNNTYTNNITFNNARGALSVGSSAKSGNLAVDPQFVNFAGGDYRLKNASPAIDAGANTYAPANDIIGGLRRGGADIGAYEFGAAPQAESAPCDPAPTPAHTPEPAPSPAPGSCTTGGTSQSASVAPGPAGAYAVKPAAGGKTYYIAPSGKDSNAGTQSSPWKTIQKAANTLSTGDTAILMDGTYEEGSISFKRSGAAGKPIMIQAQNKWKAVLSSTSGCSPGMSINASYITVRGLHLSVSPRNKTCPQFTSANVHIRAWNSINATPSNPTTGHVGFAADMLKIDTGLEKADAIKSNQDFTIIENSESGNALELLGTKNSIVRNNVIVGQNRFGISIFVKGGDRNAQIYNNIIHNKAKNAQSIIIGGYSCDACHFDTKTNIEAYNTIAYNNVVINESGGSMAALVFQGAKDSAFINNTVINGQLSMQRGGHNSGPQAPTQNATFKNNIVICGGKAVGSSIGWTGNHTGTLTIDNNNFHNCTSIPNQAHPVTGDPKLVNAASNWQLQTGSPAIDKGAPVSFKGFDGSTLMTLTKDIVNGARPQGSTIDVGAYEFGATPGTAPANDCTPAPAPTPAPANCYTNAQGDRICPGTTSPTAPVPTQGASCTGGPGGMTPYVPGTAFAGAQGGGAGTKGGRGGRVIFVTNLNNAGPGSLRACAQDASGPRICVFKVSGTIEITGSPIYVRNPYLTVAGQTSPGGIQLSGKNYIDYMVYVTADEVIWRYTRMRHGYYPGATSKGGVMSISGKNVIVDHNSVAWNHDESLGVWSHGGDDTKNITLSYNLISEGMEGHSTGPMAGGATASTMTDIDIHHNLIVNNTHRNPMLKNKSSRYVNNIMYNQGYTPQGFFVSQLIRGIQADFIGNLYKPGPMMRGKQTTKEIQITLISNTVSNPITNDSAPGIPSVYLSGNKGWSQSNPAGDQWAMAAMSRSQNAAEIGPVPATYRRNTPLPATRFPITAHSVDQLDGIILPTVGASQRLDCAGNWVDARDSMDKRNINEYRTGTGIASPLQNESTVGGFPTMPQGTSCADSDNDGIPNEYEAKNPGATIDQYLDGICKPTAPTTAPPPDTLAPLPSRLR